MKFKFDQTKKEAFKDLLGKIAEMYDPEQIVLFGSQARGDFNSTSDFDILLVDCNIKRHLSDVYTLESSLGFDVLKSTTEDLKKYKDSANNVLAIAQREGVAVYSKASKLLVD